MFRRYQATLATTFHTTAQAMHLRLSDSENRITGERKKKQQTDKQTGIPKAYERYQFWAAGDTFCCIMRAHILGPIASSVDAYNGV